MSFAPVPGHDDIADVPTPAERMTLLGRQSEWKELEAALASGRMHHAWLFQGPEGVGKATTALAFARRLLGGPEVLSGRFEGEPEFLPNHPIVRQIGQGSHPNFLHIRRPSNDKGDGFRTQITVDEIRRLNHFFRSTAADSWRIALVDPADDMNRNAANALLKILEEPPERSIFLIINHVPGRLLPTIRSRARTLRFSPLSEDAVLRGLSETLTGEDASSLATAARLSGGSLRTAFHQVLSGGLEIAGEIDRLYGAARPDWRHVQSLADALTQKGREEAWALVRNGLFDRIAAEARQAQESGDNGRATALAAFWQSESARWLEAAAFNLDRKQILITFASKLAEVRVPNR
ncbi:DNA polymerase III subunit delta' [Aureimonas sp. D3]|uniref:DNA polymerase III subunit delta' n=1 Tax=Aureimonas sp. D3 TaxID=1638164 RepID=UPI000781D981|nr:DNA polymerase III subunit delta' [Aureimonas sp. D3]